MLYKISSRFWVKEIKVKPQYVKNLLDQHQSIDDSLFDKKVYNDGRIIILPEFHKPYCEEDPSKTVLLPIENIYNISDYTITANKESDYNLNNDVKNIIRGFVDNTKNQVINLANFRNL